MKKTLLNNTHGFSLIEVLLAVIMIAICAIGMLMWQKSSWLQTSNTNKLMVAGQVIEKQIEKQRMIIAENPVVNFDQFTYTFLNKTVILTDSSTTPFIKVRWNVYDNLLDPSGHSVRNVYQVKLAAWWGTQKVDTLKVTTCIARNF
jgi:prepilin-type N-terminal cleavage/methylation domain-containing protein